MEHLNRRTEDRGQLLLVAAIGIAVLLIVLAVLLNTAIYTGAVATDGASEHEERSALAYLDGVQRGVSGIIASTNNDSDGATSEAELAAILDEEVDDWSRVASRYGAMDGVSTSVSLKSVVYGTRIVQENETRHFTNASGEAEWTVVENVSHLREFRMNVTADSLSETQNETCAEVDDCFRTTLEDDGGSAWHLYLFANESGNVVVEVITPTGSETCLSSSESVSIDLVAGTVDGESCEPMDEFPDGTTPYDITYVNADNVSGEYELGVDSRLVSASDFEEGGSPRAVPVIDEAVVTVTYRSSSLMYVTELRVSPGEGDV